MKTRLIALLTGFIMSLPVLAEEYVLLQTSEGDIYIDLNEEKAPITTENFRQYVEDGYYDGTIFHRVIPGFMAQGGGYDIDFKEQETREPIKNESDNGLSNLRGTIAMARTNEPDSATSQFFINLVDNERLDNKSYRPGYAVFGKVVRGMDVVDGIAEIPTGPAGPFRQNVPEKPVIIEDASMVSELPAEDAGANE